VNTIRRLDFRAGVLQFLLRIGLGGPLPGIWYRKVAREASELLGKTQKKYDVQRLSRAAQVLQYEYRGQRRGIRQGPSGHGRLSRAIAEEWLDAWYFHWSPHQVARRARIEAEAVGGIYTPEPPQVGSAGPGSWGPNV
jgi:hypothetical protein